MCVAWRVVFSETILLPISRACTNSFDADTPARRHVSPCAGTFLPRVLKIWATKLSDLC